MENIPSGDIFKELISAFGQLKSNIKLINDNYFDILGYSHYENINSNILAYYLSSENGHNFHTYFLEALCELLKIENIDLEYSRTFREYWTQKGGRLDILIETHNCAIGIENKIFSRLYNNLDDYYKTVESKNQQSSYLCVLSLKKEHNTSGYKNITHIDLWNKVFEKIPFEEFRENKHIIFIQEVKQNIDNLSNGKQKMNDQEKAFVLKYENEIQQIFTLKSNYEKELKQKIINLQQKIEEKGIYQKKIQMGIIRLNNDGSYILDYILFADFNLDGIILAIDIVLNKHGEWKIILLDREGGKLSNNLTNLLNSRHIDFEEITYDTMQRAQIMTSSSNESDILTSITHICEKLKLA
ncbi:PD-(D/E)XK nuclease family protein [Sulfurospirillum sp. UCH001]|uniref:PD-(D/E)XK nuclease family protein n=1 Tax=Sulfurospirillum sp. UCH001 TaxID=1581011 RepID=UPI00082DE8C5|nr:PD-(D/E)XK nuclease family protein [Sulfurospirillum sp. UCH001]